ncbi:ABC transporter permease [Candidatus Schmidhempelia bombi]|jgi:ABC-2 type transport system permease protein|uniref:ABC transporter permease n=1 Tax=Candidatus Schmidhempelia bombi str. Bimp TaxID=1387197 RepID=A0AB94IE30_9GAMM|nr:ABC transporter permease [Candidatus Schmidhempelia bombi]TEA27722.1 ABC transporter permease [Candidatus Schmidhempelia bombi str. Bimp]
MSNSLLQVIRWELSQLMKQRSLFLLVFIYPLLFIFLFIYMYHAGVITQVPIAVVDQDTSKSSRTLIQQVAASPQLLVAERYQDLSAAKHALIKGDVYAVLFIQPEFEKNLIAGHQPEVVAFYNNQYMSAGTIIFRAMSSALKTANSQIVLQGLLEKGVALPVAQSQMQTVPTSLHPLYNPTLNYLYTLISGLIPTILQIIIMMAMVTSVTRDRFAATGYQPILQLANHNIFTFLLGRITPYFIYFLLCLFLFDTVLIAYFDLPLKGHLALLILGDIGFILTSCLYGIFFGLTGSTLAQAYGSASLVASPGFGFTGLIFPRIAMNTFASIWGALIPVTWYIQIRLDQTLRAPNIMTSLEPFIYLLIQFSIISLLITLHLRKIRRRLI